MCPPESWLPGDESNHQRGNGGRQKDEQEASPAPERRLDRTRAAAGLGRPYDGRRTLGRSDGNMGHDGPLFDSEEASGSSWQIWP